MKTAAKNMLRLADRALWRMTTATSRLGERHGLDWLTYSPLQLLAYHRLARRDAPALAAGIRQAFPDAVRWIDVGAGSGALAAAANERGAEVLACERSRGGRLIARLAGLRTAPLDLDPLTSSDDTGEFDLALCIEVGEHLPPEWAGPLVERLLRLAPLVVFSAAHPGQGGLGHINEQPPEYWREQFEQAGGEHDRPRSESLATSLSAGRLHASWLKQNVQVFRRR